MTFGFGESEETEIMGKIVARIYGKYLGVHLDGSLKFDYHIDYVVKKLNKFCCLVYRIRLYSTRNA